MNNSSDSSRNPLKWYGSFKALTQHSVHMQEWAFDKYVLKEGAKTGKKFSTNSKIYNCRTEMQSNKSVNSSLWKKKFEANWFHQLIYGTLAFPFFCSKLKPF